MISSKSTSMAKASQEENAFVTVLSKANTRASCIWMVPYRYDGDFMFLPLTFHSIDCEKAMYTLQSSANVINRVFLFFILHS